MVETEHIDHRNAQWLIYSLYQFQRLQDFKGNNFSPLLNPAALHRLSKWSQFLYLFSKLFDHLLTFGGEIFRTRPDRPWGLPNLLYNGYRLFPVGKAVGAWRWPPTPT